MDANAAALSGRKIACPMRMIGLAALLVLIASAHAGPFSAQTPSFDVSSIKPNITDGASGIQAGANGRLTATNMSLRSLAPTR